MLLDQAALAMDRTCQDAIEQRIDLRKLFDALSLRCPAIVAATVRALKPTRH